MQDEFDRNLKSRLESGLRPEPIELSAICGTLIYPVIQSMADRIMEAYPEAKIHIYPIRNDFFGPTITVTGLLTGRDICAQLTGKPLGKVLLLPENVLRAGEEILLDDMTRSQLSDALQVPIHTIKSGGYDLLDLIFNQRGIYE
jgi:NifB/MoaA-like Fe-S oxidoreductase